MFRLVLMRAAFAAFSLLIVSVIIFWCVEWLPGDLASRMLGREATAEQIEVLRHKLHLDQPTTQRYMRWLGDALHGNLGTSLAADRPVFEYVWPRALNTLRLATLALVIYIPLSIALGLWT